MKARLWRLALSLALALGILSGLSLSATNASATTEPQIKHAPATNNRGGCWYVVRRGDTLFSIGMRYGVSPYYLAQINGLYNPNVIYAGMTLTVPCGHTPPKPPRPPKRVPEVCTEVKYLVRPGDNLFRIALNHGSTVNAIRDANNLWGKVLRPGSTLIVPVFYTKHKVAAIESAPPVEDAGAGQGEPPVQDSGAGKGELPPADANAVPDEQPAAPNGRVECKYPVEKEAPVKPPADPMQATPVAPVEPAQPNQQPPANGQSQGLPPEPSGSIVLTATSVEPASATISAGQSILWVNNSDNIYTIVSGLPGQPNDMFTSGELPAGATWIHTFDAAGSYSYHISENPTLIGQVTVNP